METILISLSAVYTFILDWVQFRRCLLVFCSHMYGVVDYRDNMKFLLSVQLFPCILSACILSVTALCPVQF